MTTILVADQAWASAYAEAPDRDADPDSSRAAVIHAARINGWTLDLTGVYHGRTVSVVYSRDTRVVHAHFAPHSGAITRLTVICDGRKHTMPRESGHALLRTALTELRAMSAGEVSAAARRAGRLPFTTAWAEAHAARRAESTAEVGDAVIVRARATLHGRERLSDCPAVDFGYDGDVTGVVVAVRGHLIRVEVDRVQQWVDAECVQVTR